MADRASAGGMEFEGTGNGDKPPRSTPRDKHLVSAAEGDRRLKEEFSKLLTDRREAGLEGLVGGLEAVIINTEPHRLGPASAELLRSTGHDIVEAFQDPQSVTVVLRRGGSSDILVRSRLGGDNPFLRLNLRPKSSHLPNTRLETLVFRTKDLEELVSIQRSRGVSFLTDDIIEGENCAFIQTAPSAYTGNSIGFIERGGGAPDYRTLDSETVRIDLTKQDLGHLSEINYLDHAATRVRAEDRVAAMMEFLSLTNYHFDFAIYVKELNSITSVARFEGSNFAMVFTSGISPYFSEEVSGPTEKFVHNYGARVHHLAFQTEEIEETYSSLIEDGIEFLISLVGSPKEGLKQTFTKPATHTLIVNEYIHRYGDFDGFFTKSNVTLLTESTGKQ